ncbi:C-type mannose receptor 2-like [Pangasianodon hypophthalmus]|uniref:C-type mannose receptor 2-like n=1 Tax=Pangasianodon hypophthalmus TaxID=310915 RepID=UPI002306F000|nr:C-type mannose receptor 2-like [Pangasianodon hypophthalmus]
MKNCLFLLVFYTGVISIVSRKYYLIQQEKTWSDAQAYCRATHTDLAIIKTNDDMVQLQNEAQRQQFSSSAWIGLYNDVNSWHWSFGNEPLGSVTYWESGEPNNWGGHEECVMITRSGWYDSRCTETHPFVCFDDSKTGSDRLIYISKTMTWLEAQSYCRQHHTDLASARDTTENSDIVGLVPDWTWIGLFRDSWKWSDQCNASLIIWMSGQPDNKLGKENCGYLNNGQAADALCSDIMPFFCYSETTKQQIVRMKIQSSQDVNNLAVKAAILEQIEHELKDHGMSENITVKWREQLDGVVFHKQKEGNKTRK